MALFQGIKALFLKDLKLEIRNKAGISGIALYLLSTVLICFFTFSLRQNLITPAVWSALFWIILLFTAINAVAKSFLAESRGLSIYYYSLLPPGTFILGRITYNFLICFLLFLTAYMLFILLIFNPIQHTGLFIATLALVALGFSGSMTLVSGLAAKAGNSHVLMAVLSFPVIISLLLIAIRITRNCVDGLEASLVYPDLLTMAAINMISVTTSYLLFPYIWRS